MPVWRRAPKRLLLFFLSDRCLLGALSRCARGTMRDVYRFGPYRFEVRGAATNLVLYGQGFAGEKAWSGPFPAGQKHAGVVGAFE